MNPRFKTEWLALALTACIALYVGLIAHYLLFGGFRIDFPFRVVMDEWEKPGLILFFALTLRIALSFYMGEIKPLLNFLQTRQAALTLALIIVFGFIIRFWGMGQGIDYKIYHPDALKQVLAVQNFLDGNYSFDLEYLGKNRSMAGYPFFAMYFPATIVAGLEWLGGVVNVDTSFRTTDSIIFIARSLNIVYSLLIIFFTYRIGLILSGTRSTALLTAFLVSASLVQIQMGKYVGADIPMSLFALIAIYFMCLNLDRERLLNYILVGLFIGLSSASKYNGVLTFIVIGFIYLKLHPFGKDFFRAILRPFISLLICVTTFLVTSANFWADPEAAFKAIRIALDYSSNYALPPEYFSKHYVLLFKWFDYNTWVFSYFFKPVPAWVAIIAILLVIFRYRWKMVHIWAPPFIIFLIGKMSMPISATHHYLHILPLFLLTVAIGINEALKPVPFKWLSSAVLVFFSVYLGYGTVQDNSLWLIKPAAASQFDWVSNNFGSHSNPYYSKRILCEEAPPPHISRGSMEKKRDGYHLLRRFQNGDGRAITLHRGKEVSCWLRLSRKAPLFPTVHFPSKMKAEFIHPDNPDFVYTDKYFMTGVKDMRRARRYLIASEAPGKLVIWIKNFSDKKNRVQGEAGGEKFEYALAPRESVIHVVKKPGTAFLFNGKLVLIDTRSTTSAGWVIGTNHTDIGDIYLYNGQSAKALESFIKSGDVYGLFQTIIHAGSSEIRDEAVLLLNKLNPDILEQDFEENDPQLWKKIAGYSDDVFKDQMTRQIKHTDNINAAKVFDGWEISGGATLFGPYIPLNRGEYEVEITWRNKISVDSFTVDVASNLGKKILAEKNIEIENANDNHHTFKFHIDDLMEYPVEIRVHSVKGGVLALKNVKLKLKFKNEMLRLIKKAQKTKSTDTVSADGRGRLPR